MLCESCNEREATIHLTQVIDGSVKKVHLCEQCAEENGLDIESPMSITDILVGMGMSKEPTDYDGTDVMCPACHLRRADFKKTGRLGCPKCYDVFTEDLMPLIKVMHRNEQHIGKVPASQGLGIQMTAEIAALQQQLEKAVALEKYEEAAHLRDQIRECRQKAEEGEGCE